MFKCKNSFLNNIKNITQSSQLKKRYLFIKLHLKATIPQRLEEQVFLKT